jgi:hypothetical protein
LSRNAAFYLVVIVKKQYAYYGLSTPFPIHQIRHVAPAPDTTEGKLKKQLKEMIKKMEGKGNPAGTEFSALARLKLPNGAAEGKAAAPPSAKEKLASKERNNYEGFGGDRCFEFFQEGCIWFANEEE